MKENASDGKEYDQALSGEIANVSVACTAAANESVASATAANKSLVRAVAANESVASAAAVDLSVAGGGGGAANAGKDACINSEDEDDGDDVERACVVQDLSVFCTRTPEMS